MDFTRDNGNAVIRARKLAWKGDENKKGKDPYNAFDSAIFKQHQREFYRFRDTDLSFKYDWQGKGKWDV